MARQLTEPPWLHTTNHGIEAYALKHNRLHPRLVNFLQPLFDSQDLDLDLSTVRMIVYPKITSTLNTKVWVMGDKIVWHKGSLNAEYAIWYPYPAFPDWAISNKAIDLTTVRGMRVLCHELFHVVQWRRLGFFRAIGLYLYGIMKSLWNEGNWYSHRQVPLEREAGAFQMGPANDYIQSRREHLKDFEELR